MALRFVPHHLLADTPNVIVDGSPTPSTVVTLSHWPGSPTPPEVLDDLSAQIVFRALDRPGLLDGAQAVSNNHADQDGLVSVYALTRPDDAVRRRAALIDVARAGDFATFDERDAIRLAFTIAAWCEPDRSPLDTSVFTGGYDEQCGALYEALLPVLPEMLDDVDRFRPWWGEEDAHLQESLDAIASGIVTIEERRDLDLAVVRVPNDWADRVTTRFTVHRADALHPAAIHRSTDRMRVAVVQDGRPRLECRYETWVMYRSRPLVPRPDLRPLAGILAELDPSAGWQADAPGALTPSLRAASAASELTTIAWLATVQDYLRAAPPAWDPMTAASPVA